jgi:septal ring factor EnvC (AmiA/AmiB activator)
MSTQKNVKKSGGNAPTNPEKKSKIVGEKKGIASAVQQRLANLEKREKRLVAIIEKRTAYLAKLQKNLDTFKAALEKIQKQKAVELQAIKELTEIVNGNSKA